MLHMHNAFRFPFSFLTLCAGSVATMAVIYIALIAVAMSYAVLTVSFSQSVKNDQATVAMLESQYLANIADIEGIDYQTLGYVTPTTRSFVHGQSVTALR